MNGKENLLQNGNKVVYSGIMTDGQNRENPNTFDTKEKEAGMTPSQALVNHFSDKINSEGKDFIDKLGRFVGKVDDKREKADTFDKLMSLAPTNEEIIEPWLSAVAGKALIDYDKKLFREGRKSEIDWKDEENQKKYYSLVSDMESKWQKLAVLGRNVDVSLNYLQGSELVKSNFEEKFGELGDGLFDFVAKSTDAFSNSKVAKGIFLGSTIVSGVLLESACALNAAIDNTPAEVATINSTSEATQAPTPTRPDFAGGAYTAEEQALINSSTFKETENALTAWTKYWANATNNPFHPDTTDLHFKYVFDSEGSTAGVCMESTAYDNTCFALPIVDGYALMTPPTASGDYEIPGGFGPLQMSIVMTAEQVSSLGLDESFVGSILGYENGSWVRVKDGVTVGVLDLETAQWKVKSGELENIDSLFKESGTVESEHISMRVSQKSLETIGIPNGFDVDPAKLEDAYKILVGQWAWALAKASDDPKLTVFESVDQSSLEAMLKAYDDNAALGENGFDYYFNFGLAYGGGIKNVEGKVENVNISLTGDQGEWNSIIENLRENNIVFCIRSIPNSGNQVVFYFSENGLEVLYNGANKYYPDVINGFLITAFSVPMVSGEASVEEAAGMGAMTWTSSSSIWQLFGCDGPDFCSTPGSTSDFKY